MNTNKVADEISIYLHQKYERVYRNSAPKESTYPYIVYRIDSGVDFYPSENIYVNIDIYEDSNVSVRAIEDIADTIDGDGNITGDDGTIKESTGLNHKVINTEKLNLQFEKEQRQYVSPQELVSVHLINIRYVVQVYVK